MSRTTVRRAKAPRLTRQHAAAIRAAVGEVIDAIQAVADLDGLFWSVLYFARQEIHQAAQNNGCAWSPLEPRGHPYPDHAIPAYRELGRAIARFRNLVDDDLLGSGEPAYRDMLDLLSQAEAVVVDEVERKDGLPIGTARRLRAI